jgi:predicted polyphosphate/ATP-dependent NAD kinase
MKKVGIIANPASGKDIRRLVAYASLMDNRDKMDLVRRLILGAQSTGVDEIIIMPDYYGLGAGAVSGLTRGALHTPVTILEMPVTGTQEDSGTAARRMKEEGVGCIVTVGGDGTNRAVACGERTVPMIPVSTGTNNVFPGMVEATTAGIAAGIVAGGHAGDETAITTHKRLVIDVDGKERDMALVDAVVLEQAFIGARAVWNLDEVRQVFCTRAQPDTIGLSAIGGGLCQVNPEDDCGLYLEIGEGRWRTRAAVLPGIIQEIPVREVRRVAFGESTAVAMRPCLIALDGEREMTVAAGDEVTIRVERDGPRVVDISKVIRQAASLGFFSEDSQSK